MFPLGDETRASQQIIYNDKEIQGEKKKAFVLGAGGEVNRLPSLKIKFGCGSLQINLLSLNSSK